MTRTALTSSAATLILVFAQQSSCFAPSLVLGRTDRSSRLQKMQTIDQEQAQQFQQHDHVHVPTDLFFEELQWAEEGDLHLHTPLNDDWILHEFNNHHHAADDDDDIVDNDHQQQQQHHVSSGHHEWFSNPATIPQVPSHLMRKPASMDQPSIAHQPTEWFSQHIRDDAVVANVAAKQAASLNMVETSKTSGGGDWFGQAMQWQATKRDDKTSRNCLQISPMTRNGMEQESRQHVDWFAAAIFDNI